MSQSSPSAALAAAPLALPAELTIYTVSELHPQWLGWLHHEATAVDAAAVEQVDGAGLQLLLSLSHALDQRGRALRLRAPSAALREGCSAMGLQDWLHTHSAAEATT